MHRAERTGHRIDHRSRLDALDHTRRRLRQRLGTRRRLYPGFDDAGRTTWSTLAPGPTPGGTTGMSRGEGDIRPSGRFGRGRWNSDASLRFGNRGYSDGSNRSSILALRIVGVPVFDCGCPSLSIVGVPVFLSHCSSRPGPQRLKGQIHSSNYRLRFRTCGCPSLLSQSSLDCLPCHFELWVSQSFLPYPYRETTLAFSQRKSK
jgi:hypothetical protein